LTKHKGLLDKDASAAPLTVAARGVVLKKKCVGAIIRSGWTPNVCKVTNVAYIKRTKWIISYKEVCGRRPPPSTPDYTPGYSLQAEMLLDQSRNFIPRLLYGVLNH